MPRHEQYEELCTLAMIGELSAAELKDLKSHLEECAECRQEYREFVQFALPQLSLVSEVEPVADTKTSDRQAIRSRFLKRAAGAGVPFSAAALAGKPSATKPEIPVRQPVWWASPILRYGLAGSLAAILIVGAWYQGRRSVDRVVARSVNPPEEKALPASPAVQPVQAPVANQPDSEKEVAKLRDGLNDTTVRLAKAQAALDAATAERAELKDQLAKQTALLRKTESDRQGSAEVSADLQAQLEKLQKRESALEADYVAQVASVSDLKQKLNEQETAMSREPARPSSTDSEVRELMASRNLHIVDVFDTDGRGKQKPIFGRVFFAENKQLIFYAYDLNDIQGQDVRIDYHVWGQKEGPGQSARSLGRFRPDDRSRGRWVFESANGKLLSEIDSIFVTVEKSDSPKSEPKGQKLMYAYLRDHPNHP